MFGFRENTGPSLELLNALNMASAGIPAGVSLKSLADSISKCAALSFLSRGFRLAEVIPPDHVEVLRRFGLTEEYFIEAARVAHMPSLEAVNERTNSAVEDAAQRIISTLESMLTPSMEPISALSDGLNPWYCCSLIYAAWKLGELAKKGIDIGDVEKLKRIASRAKEHLFSPGIFICKDKKYIGWDAEYLGASEDEANSHRKPLLHDTAFITNILVRIDPNRKDDHYEKCLDTVINFLDGDHYLWVDTPDSGYFDLIGTSYAVRLLSNYLVRRADYSRMDLGYLTHVRDRAVDNLLILQADGHWTGQYVDRSNMLPVYPEYTRLSKQVCTALIVHALRSAQLPRSNEQVMAACEWLLSQMRFYLPDKESPSSGNFCWTDNGQFDSKPNQFDSAIILSSLLRSSYYSKFSKALDVVGWISNELNNHKFDSSPVVGTMICALCDFLRSREEKAFMEA